MMAATTAAPRLVVSGLRLCPSRPQRCPSHMSGTLIRGQAGSESGGLWLPPTRPSRKSVQAQAQGVTGEAKIKVCVWPA